MADAEIIELQHDDYAYIAVKGARLCSTGERPNDYPGDRDAAPSRRRWVADGQEHFWLTLFTPSPLQTSV